MKFSLLFKRENNERKSLQIGSIGYDFFLLKQIEVFNVKPESGGFNLLFWLLNDDLVVGSILFDWKVNKSNQTT